MRGLRFGRGFGFGHLFGLLFLARHPILFVVIAVVVFAVYLYRKRR
jgi:4-amino-4-deoxy-L-arabinose transferase-like glycosyltransferase